MPFAITLKENAYFINKRGLAATSLTNYPDVSEEGIDFITKKTYEEDKLVYKVKGRFTR